MRDPPSEPGSPRHDLAEPDDARRSAASAVLRSMPTERRAVLALAIGQRLSYRQIARRLGTTEEATKVHIRDGLATMYKHVMPHASTTGRTRR